MMDYNADPSNPVIAKEIAKAPLLKTPYQDFLFESFNELSTERISTMSLGPIPITAMLIHAKFYELTKSETKAFVQIMRGMDRAYIAYYRRKSEAESKKHQTKGN